MCIFCIYIYTFVCIFGVFIFFHKNIYIYVYNIFFIYTYMIGIEVESCPPPTMGFVQLKSKKHFKRCEIILEVL